MSFGVPVFIHLFCYDNMMCRTKRDDAYSEQVIFSFNEDFILTLIVFLLMLDNKEHFTLFVCWKFVFWRNVITWRRYGYTYSELNRAIYVVKLLVILTLTIFLTCVDQRLQL